MADIRNHASNIFFGDVVLSNFVLSNFVLRGTYLAGAILSGLASLILLGCENSSTTSLDREQRSGHDTTLASGPIEPSGKRVLLDRQSREKIQAALVANERGIKLSLNEVHELTKIAESYPESNDAVFVAVQSLEGWFDFDGIVKLFRNLPPNEERADYLAFYLIKASRYDEAIELLSTLIDVDPTNHTRIWRKGYALAFAGRDDEAVPLIEGVLDQLTGEELVSASNILGQYYLEKAELETSIKHFQRSRKLDPNDLHSLISLAAIHQRNGATELANSYHEEAIRVRNEKAMKDLVEKRYATLSADLRQYFEAGDYQNCNVLIEKMKADANATQLGQLRRLEQEIERRK